MTNYELLTSSPDRLAIFLAKECPPHKSVEDTFCVKFRKGEYTYQACKDCWWEWLEQEVDE